MLIASLFFQQDLSTLVCEVCVLVFSVTDRRSFHRTAQLRLLLRENQPQTPIILVGNKSDLVRSREVSTEGMSFTTDLLILKDMRYLEYFYALFGQGFGSKEGFSIFLPSILFNLLQKTKQNQVQVEFKRQNNIIYTVVKLAQN